MNNKSETVKHNFETWLENELKTLKDYVVLYGDGAIRQSTLKEILCKWHELKGDTNENLNK